MCQDASRHPRDWRFLKTSSVSSVSDWKVKWQHWAWKTLADGHTSITVAIDYGADANAAAKWRLAGGARCRSLLPGAASKRKGRSRILTHDWWPVDRFRGMFRFTTGPGLWRVATAATRSLINLLSAPKMDGAQLWWESMRAAQEESWRLLPPCCVMMGRRVSSRRNVVNHEGAH